jgi:hypothetical protein
MTTHGTSQILHREFRLSVSSSESSSSCGPSSLCLLTNFKVLGLFIFLQQLLKTSDPSKHSPSLYLSEKHLYALLVATFRTFPSAEIPSALCTPAAVVSKLFAQVRNPETSLSLGTPCTTPVLDCTSVEMRTKSISPELSEATL